VAATRARTELNLVAVRSVDPKTGEWAEPNAGSLLARLWPFRPKLPVPGDGTNASDAQATEPWWVGPPLLRRSQPLGAIGQADSPQVAATKRKDRFVWPIAESAERISGILIHAWLARFALQADRDQSAASLAVPPLPALERQLRALGLAAPLRPDAAVEVAAALDAMLSSEHGQWLLQQPLRQVEWALIDARQTVSIMDLAIDLPEGWLVVDYKTSRPTPHEDRRAFEARMTARYGAQMQRYREQLQALDGRGARSVLFFPRDDIWLEVA